MKKGLSLLLAASLALSTFVTAALAADPVTAEEKYNALVEAGIFEGFPDGQAHLDQNMTRAQAAKIIALVLGLGENAAAASIYTDLAEAQWAAGWIGSATAVGILQGRGNGIFDPSSDVTIQELAKIMVEALNIDVDESATVEGADEWAGPYVAAAIAAGLLAEQADYTTPATRELLVETSYSAYEQVKPVTEITAAAAATGAKQITVTFNQAVDTAKASIAVTFNNNTVNPSKTTFAEDSKSVVIEFANPLAAGDYVVTVSGLTEEALTSTVKIEAQKVAKIEFTTSQAVKDRNNEDTVKVGYQVLNQYGEKMSNVSLTASASKGTATASGGVITVDADPNDNLNVTFTIGEKVAISIIEPVSGEFASQTFDVVAAAHVATVGISELHQASDKELVAGSTETFYLVLDLKDQYGNAITDDDFASDLIVTVSNPAVASLVGYNNNNTANITEQSIDGSTKLVLTLKNGADLKAGLSIVSIISKYSGARATFDVNVKDTSKIDTLTLTTPQLAPAGEKVNIPYTAIDQFGADVKHPTKAGLTNLVVSAGTIDFVKDIVKDETNLVLDLAGVAKGTVYVTGYTATNKPFTLNITVVDAAVPTVISGVKGISTLLKGDEKRVTVGDNVVVKDQYGRDISLSGDYGVSFTKSGDAVTVVDEDGDDEVLTLPATFTAAKKGSSSVTLTLTDDGTAVSNSSFTFSYNVVESGDISSYEATVTDTVYDDGGNTYAKALEVKGVLADGSKVTIPYKDGANYKVVVPSSSSALSHNADGKIVSDGSFFAEADKNGEGTVIVTITANSQVIPVTVAVSSAAPAITTLALVNGDYSDKEGDKLISVDINELVARGLTAIIEDAVQAKDQYGIEVDETYPASNIIVSGLGTGKTIAGVNGEAATNLVKEDTFNVLAFTENGKSIDFKVIVKGDPGA